MVINNRIDALGVANHLVALLSGREVGRVRQDNRGRLSLVYASNWRDAPDAYPMSLSMPLAVITDSAAGAVRYWINARDAPACFDAAFTPPTMTM